MAREYPKGREDHYLPQGYLRGFIDPTVTKIESQPLWIFDIKRRHWRKQSTSQIGWEEGFYDFVGRQGEREHAEDAFVRLENDYSPLIQQMRETRFRNWREHITFLLRYLQMIRCRSPLYREEFIQEWGKKRAARVIGVEGSNKIKVDSLKLRRLSPGALKEGSINAMLGEMKKGTAILESFYWQIRLADSIDDSFITSDHPLLAWTNDGKNVDHRSTVMVFPLCWEACLIGRRDPFALSFNSTNRYERESIRRAYFASAEKFIVSLHKLH